MNENYKWDPYFNNWDNWIPIELPKSEGMQKHLEEIEANEPNSPIKQSFAKRNSIVPISPI